MSYVAEIDELHRLRGASAAPRGYLGASSLGHDCERYLWLQWRWCVVEDKEGRMVRLLEAGNTFEEQLVKDLKDLGHSVVEVDPDTGDQWAVKFAKGHGGGHTDGLVNDSILLEAKTSNNKGFNTTKKNGVQKAKPQHYAQMQIYMGHLGLTEALYIMMNKDTSELYEERLGFDHIEFKRLMQRADDLVAATEPPERNKGYWCLYCDARHSCRKVEKTLTSGEHKVYSKGTMIPPNSCRNCVHATPVEDGKWRCEHYDCEIPIEKQRDSAKCPSHLYIPGVINAEVAGSDSDGVHYKLEGGGHFFNRTATAGITGYTSQELAALGDLDLLASVDHVKQVFGGTVEVVR